MSLAIVVKLLHILAVIWFISGLLGRWLALGQAAKATRVQTVSDMVKFAGIFERTMVIPGWQAVFLLGLITAWLGGWPLLGFLQGASSNWVLVAIVLFLTQLPLIPLVFLPRGKIFGQALEQSVSQGHVTPELTAAFSDRAVYASHIYELVSVFAIVVLMVTKPF